MCIRKFVPMLLLFALSSNVNATSFHPLQPRDLDGDPTTIEAYYYGAQNLTWLADTAIGKSNTFGLQRAPFTDYGSEVNDQGLMLRDALPGFIAGMNQNQYLGYSNWRLPVAQSTADPCCSDLSLVCFVVCYIGTRQTATFCVSGTRWSSSSDTI